MMGDIDRMAVLAHTDDAVIEFIDAWAHDWANDQWRALTASEQLDVGRRIMDAATTKLRGAVDALESIERLRVTHDAMTSGSTAWIAVGRDADRIAHDYLRGGQ